MLVVVLLLTLLTLLTLLLLLFQLFNFIFPAFDELLNGGDIFFRTRKGRLEFQRVLVRNEVQFQGVYDFLESLRGDGCGELSAFILPFILIAAV